MAGDWIKMRGNLWDDPRVARLVDLTDSSEAAVIGGLYWLWATADQHTADGLMPGLSTRQIDRKTGVRGLGQALVDIGWLIDHEDGVRIVNFEDHNGASAKKRAQTAKRVANHRIGNADETTNDESRNASSVTGALAREREEKNKEELPPNPPCQGGGESEQPPAAKPKRERKERQSLKTFLERCKAAGETAVSGYKPLLEYVDTVGLPQEFVQLAWDVFKAEHLPNGTNERRLQSDWRRHFLNYVTKGYYRLWYADAANNSYVLTTQGVQAQRAHARKEAA